MTNRHFEKPLTMPIQICKNFLCKMFVIYFLLVKPFQNAKNYPNLTTESGSKQRFSLLQEKSIHLRSVPEDSGS